MILELLLTNIHEMFLALSPNFIAIDANFVAAPSNIQIGRRTAIAVINYIQSKSGSRRWRMTPRVGEKTCSKISLYFDVVLAQDTKISQFSVQRINRSEDH